MKVKAIITRNYKRDFEVINKLLKGNSDKVVLEFPEIGEVDNKKYLKHPLELKEELIKYINCVKDNVEEITIVTNSTVVINTLTYLEFKKEINKLKIYYVDNTVREIDVVKGFFYENEKDIAFPEGFFDATLEEIFEINNF